MWRLAQVQLDAMQSIDGPELAGVAPAVDALRDAVVRATDATSGATLLERIAFSLWPASADDDDEHWHVAWVAIASLAGIPEALALDAVDISADDHRRTPRRQRAAMRKRILAERGTVRTYDPTTGITSLNSEYEECIKVEAAQRLREA
ncbi:MAG: hypothetical protein ACKV2T_32905 [Kofleriaceae bacterium]